MKTKSVVSLIVGAALAAGAFVASVFAKGAYSELKASKEAEKAVEPEAAEEEETKEPEEAAEPETAE